jgi:citrate lyase subunit beta / citryl-CoA lyase
VTRPVITLLYVPGDQPERVVKALASDADVVIVDLEDAVRPEAKAAARDNLPSLLGGVDSTQGLQVRINALTTRWVDEDLEAVSALPPGVGVRVPKCEDPLALDDLDRRLGSRPLHLLVESALGVEAAFALTQCVRVASIGLGEADLRADLGVIDDGGLLWARSRIVNAAAAAGLPPPSMSVYPDVADLDGLRESCAAGRRLGFLGRAAIHPRQLPVISAAFRPPVADVARARELLAAADTSDAGAVLTADGRFVDEAVLREARRTLALAED